MECGDRTKHNVKNTAKKDIKMSKKYLNVVRKIMLTIVKFYLIAFYDIDFHKTDLHPKL
jgi:hypothetical protein